MRASHSQLAYARPESLDQALTLLQTDQYRIIAGGTDFYPSLTDRAVTTPVIDITAINELRTLKVDEQGVQIGALCSWSDIARAKLPASLKALQLAALEVGSVQIQSRATIAGNLCNASPAADGVPPLLCCDAIVNIASVKGLRSVALPEFVLGNRRTHCAADELVTSITIPASACHGQSDFLKLGARKYLVISIAMVATRLVIKDGLIIEAAIAVGSCSEVAIRLSEVERALVGQLATEQTVVAAVSDKLTSLSPIDDVRGSAAYRLDASASLIRRSLKKCIQAGCQTTV